MKAVQKNNNITIKKLQQYIMKNLEKSRLSEENAKKIIKAMKSKYISREIRNIFYQECMKRASSKKKKAENQYMHLTLAERVTIEILYTVEFNKNFIALFLNRDRSTMGRKLDKNVREYRDMKNIKLPYKHKGKCVIFGVFLLYEREKKEEIIKNNDRCGRKLIDRKK